MWLLAEFGFVWGVKEEQGAWSPSSKVSEFDQGLMAGIKPAGEVRHRHLASISPEDQPLPWRRGEFKPQILTMRG